MRKLYLFLAWLSLSVVSYTQTLVAYYPFNGNANDQSGNNINPTYTGAGVTLTTDRFGNTNKAYQFDGASGSYMRMPSDLLPTTNRTISLWFNAASTSIRPVMLGYGGQADLGYGTSFLMGLNISGCGCYHTQAHYYTNQVSYNYSTDPVNQWIHWVVTINGNTTKMYVNGTLVANVPGSFTSNTYVPGRDFSIGVPVNVSGVAPYTDVNGGYFQGKLDDIRIYDAAMTDAQVLQLYNNESYGLVAYYPFNGNANDESGNGRNGTVMNGATLTTDRFGNAGSAYSFDGINDYIDASATGLPTTNRTVTFWLNPATGNQPSYPLSYGGVSCGYSFLMAFNPGGCGCYSTQGHCGTNALSYNWVTNPENKWVHYAVTINGTAIKIYINGVQAASNNNFSNATYVDGRKLIIGGLVWVDGLSTYIDGSGGYFKGKLDDIRIYDRLLSPNEILQLADKPMMPDLIAYLPMNGNANDMSGNGHHGTVVNLTPTSDKYNNSNSAYSFDPSLSDFTLANSASLDFVGSNHKFTLSAWVKYSGRRELYQAIISKLNTGSAGPGTPNGYILGTDHNFYKFWIPDGNTGNWNIVETPCIVDDTRWHHVVATYDGTIQSLYLDGVLKSSDNVVYSIPATGAPVKIGSVNVIGYPTGGGIFDGSIDEVKIYGAALDAAQVSVLYKQSRGSGNAIRMQGNGYFDIGNLGAPHFFTVEAWIKRINATATQYVLSGNGANSWSFGVTTSRLFVSLNGASTVTSQDVPEINDGKWHHVAVAFQDGPMNFYVDGVHKGWTEIGTSGLSASNYSIGTQFSPGNSFDGEIDEIRIWDWVLDADNPDTIRSWMNRKITPAHPVYSNLVRYYSFNEPNLNKTYDMSGANTGLLMNNIGSVISGAAIGDASVYDFINQSPAFTLPGGESFNADASGGSPVGISVYLVKDPPLNQTGILGLGSNDHYFGVQVSGGISPTYTAEYSYEGSSIVSPATEPTLQLFKRNDNSVTTWANSGAVLNTTVNTLTVTGQNTEYILGSSGFGLPVTLLSFQAQKINATTAKLTWQTATELNNKGFEIQRSFDGNYFVNVGFVNGAGNSDVLKEYSTTDIPGKTGRVYYRLKQVDFDEHSKLSQIVSVVFDKQGIIKVYPNPAQRQVTIEGVDQYSRVQLLDAAGKLVKEQLNNGQYLLNMSLDGCKSGMYLLRLINGKDNTTIKLMIGN